MQALGHGQDGLATADTPDRTFDLVGFQELVTSGCKPAASRFLDDGADAVLPCPAFQFGEIGGKNFQTEILIGSGFFHPSILGRAVHERFHQSDDRVIGIDHRVLQRFDRSVRRALVVFQRLLLSDDLDDRPNGILLADGVPHGFIVSGIPVDRTGGPCRKTGIRGSEAGLDRGSEF